MRRSFALVVLVVAGCSRALTPPVTVTAVKDLGSRPIRTVALLPAEVSPDAKASPSAAATVTEVLAQAAARRFKVADPDRVTAALPSIPEGDRIDARAGALAGKVGADATLAVAVESFREREGGDYGAKEPASVALDILLVSVKEARILWKASYAYTQQPLAYDLWSFWSIVRGGPKWLTAAEIARIGIDEAFSRLAATLGGSNAKRHP